MTIAGINVHIVRTKYDYETYVPESYRSQYPYDTQKQYFPWIIISPDKVDNDEGILPLKFNVAFSPTADFTNLTESDACKVSADGKYLECDFTRYNHLMIDVNLEVYPNGEFDGNFELTSFVGTLAAPTAKIVTEVKELDVNEAQALIALNFAQQGQKEVGALLNTIATKVYGVTYKTPPIEE